MSEAGRVLMVGDALQPAGEQSQANGRDGSAGGKAEPWVQPFRNDPSGGVQHDETESEDAKSVADGHREAEKHGLPGGPAAADQIRADHGLAVPGLQGMRGAQTEGD